MKVGFSSAPLNRLRTLHARYFEFFDLDKSFLIEVDHLRDARRIERFFINTLADHRAPSPLVVRRDAAGHTEWFRFAYPQALALAETVCADEALVMHHPLRTWLVAQLGERLDVLYQWSSHLLDAIEFARHNSAPDIADHYAKALRNVIDTYVAIGMAVADYVPGDVMAWYQTDCSPQW